LIESHTPDEDRAICDLIVNFEYDAFRIADRCWVRARNEPYPHPDGVWGNLFLCPKERRVRVAELVAGG
jgi:hypothetical protein